MTKEALKNEIEPLLTGDLNERFYAAVHEEPVLFYDVVQTGWTNGMVPYEMVLLHAGNVDDALLGKMMVLQGKVAKHPAPHAENTIDYKSEDDVIAHYSDNGLGLGIFSIDGSLIGQVMLSFEQDENTVTEQIKWLMVDGDYRGNNLCNELLGMAVRVGEGSDISQINANVRVSNEKGIAKFAQLGFVATGVSQNTKDGSKNLKVCKIMGHQMQPHIEAQAYPQPLAGLQNPQKLSAFEDLLNKGYVAKWDHCSKWFTFYRTAKSAPALQLVVSGPK